MAFCIDNIPEFENLKDECALLNEYITASRYPSDLPFESIGREDAVEAIEAADKIEIFVKEKMNIPLLNIEK